ncbi:hypothetical protein NA57DRAFT_76126 [Rhizodiscina lignyota]|uniref:GST N-terminal domain-containing protein n=1 Tax=Rhizodiscina lignyota TaxID=1504668 RepID=A0A9P4M909_9PEZI|nr:hypothetical protein NA57DRAFT_76126 [Rhizodiscina lignyota]
MAPMLLYAFLWGTNIFAPCPRRVIVYLQEKKIPSSVVTIVTSDEHAKKNNYPPVPEGQVPILAIPKDDKPGEYEWLWQSVAIIEYLEDYCDAHPEVTSMPSMRGRQLQRAQIRGATYWVSEIFEAFGVTVMFGNQEYIDKLKRSSAAPQSAKEMKARTEPVTAKLDNILPSISDVGALSSGREGVATMADCALFATWQFCISTYGVDLAKGYPNIVKVVEAFNKRPWAIPEGYPGQGMEAWRESWIDGIWV